MKEAKERMHTGELYLPGDASIMREQVVKLDKLFDYNQLKPSQSEEKARLMKEMFAEVGENCYLETPFHANFGGGHVHLGDNVYGNFNLTLVDDTDIFIGSNTMFGPNVTVATAGHPIHAELRRAAYQYNMPVRIGENCWIGANSVVLPGVTIGDNVVVGAGSVVTKDLPSNVVAVGNPCRVLRDITEHDACYYFKQREIDWDTIRQESGLTAN